MNVCVSLRQCYQSETTVSIEYLCALVCVTEFDIYKNVCVCMHVCMSCVYLCVCVSACEYEPGCISVCVCV